MARYDFALNRFADAEAWNRTTHDVSAEVAPSLPPIRLRLGAAVRIGSWTEDRKPANQILLRPRIEIRPSSAHLLDVYVMQSARRIDVGGETRTDTFRLAGMGYFLMVARRRPARRRALRGQRIGIRAESLCRLDGLQLDAHPARGLAPSHARSGA